MRTLTPLLCAALLLGGCGPRAEGPAGLRVQVVTLDPDGPPPQPLFLRREDSAEPGREYPLEPTGEPGVYLARGAPDGHYRIVSPHAWGMLWTQPTPPLLEAGPGRPPRPLPLGRPRCLYVTTEDARRWMVSPEWGVEVRRPGGAFTPVLVEVIEQGGWVGLRIPAEHWQPGNELRALGRLSDGRATQLLGVPLSERLGDEPRLGLVHPAPAAPLLVRVVPAPARTPVPVPDGTPVRLARRALPLDLVEERTTFRGVATFDAVPTLDAPLVVSLPGRAEAAVEVSFDEWQRLGEVWILGEPPAGEARDLDLVLPEDASGGSEAPEVLVRAEGADVYGLAIVGRGPRGWRLRTGAGAQRLWVRVGRSWHPAAVPAGSDPTPVALGPAQATVRVRGTVPGLPPGHRVRFFRLEDESWVLGHGFDVLLTPLGFDARLPPGRYAAGPVRADGQLARRVEFTLEPGTEVRRDFALR